MPCQRLAPWTIVVVAITALSLALSAEYFLNLKPCILCLYQRLPYVATGLLALLALKRPLGSPAIALIIGLCAAAYLSGAGIAFYHVGVERHWWLSACSGQPVEQISFNQLQAALSAGVEKSCDAVDWTMFGFSMATYNAVFSLAMGLASSMAARQIMKNNKLKKTAA